MNPCKCAFLALAACCFLANVAFGDHTTMSGRPGGRRTRPTKPGQTTAAGTGGSGATTAAGGSAGTGSGATTVAGGSAGTGSGATTAAGGSAGTGSGVTTAAGGSAGTGSGATTAAGGSASTGSGATTAAGGSAGTGSGGTTGPAGSGATTGAAGGATTPGGSPKDPLAALEPKEKYCEANKKHTACLYKGGEKGACGQTEKRGLTEKQIKELVKRHNEKRRTVAKGEQKGQPPASNMAALIWNEEAAAIAQVWVDQCNFTHDISRETVKTGKAVYNGQNLFQSNGEDEFEIEKAIEAWFDEVKDFDKSGVNSFKFSNTTGHYTQMVWATTTSIGCGYTLKKGEHLLACNYAPGGNMKGEPVYKAGKACSACPDDLKDCDEGLCAGAAGNSTTSPAPTQASPRGSRQRIRL